MSRSGSSSGLHSVVVCCPALPCSALPCLALPCLALPWAALHRIALNFVAFHSAALRLHLVSTHQLPPPSVLSRRPRLCVSVYQIDALGRDIVLGYGVTHVPTQPGTYTRYLRTFKPVPASTLQRVTSFVLGTHAEFFDSKFVGQARDRDLTRVESTGLVKVTITVTTRNMQREGYTQGRPELSDILGQSRAASAAAATTSGGGTVAETPMR